MNAQPFIVKEALRTNPLDTLTAEDANTKEGIGYKQGTAEELCEYLDLLHANYAVPYRVTLTNSAAVRKGAGRPTNDERARPSKFVFVLRGGQAAPAPVNAAPPVVAPVSNDLAREAGENKARAELLKEERDRLLAELEAKEDELEELGEDVDEAEEQLNAAPPTAPPQPFWYQQEWFGNLVQKIGEPLGHAIASKLLGPAATSKPAAPVAPVTGEPSEDEQRAFAAIRRAFASETPENRAAYLAWLEQTYPAVPHAKA